MYRQLDEAQIIRTLERLRDRIGERFPEAGLRKVSDDLLALARETSACVDYLRRPNWPLRLVSGAVVVGLVALLTALALTVRLPAGVNALSDAVQMIEAAVNDVIFVGIAVYFLATVESRLKRHRALKTIHQLRSLAHIVDMHQLTKDPERILAGVNEIEELTTGLSSKIWQKITILDRVLARSAARSPVPAAATAPAPAR